MTTKKLGPMEAVCPTISLTVSRAVYHWWRATGDDGVRPAVSGACGMVWSRARRCNGARDRLWRSARSKVAREL